MRRLFQIAATLTILGVLATGAIVAFAPTNSCAGGGCNSTIGSCDDVHFYIGQDTVDGVVHDFMYYDFPFSCSSGSGGCAASVSVIYYVWNPVTQAWDDGPPIFWANLPADCGGPSNGDGYFDLGVHNSMSYKWARCKVYNASASYVQTNNWPDSCLQNVYWGAGGP